jgi:AbrB family looped-hinge helix DNA binding protein
MGTPHSIKLAGTVSLGPKGQVVIPADVRESMNIQPGDKLIALYSPEKKAVTFITEAGAQSLIDTLGDKLSGLKSVINNKE